MPALVLLNSVDVGMETVHTDGLQDWDAVQVSESEGRGECGERRVWE